MTSGGPFTFLEVAAKLNDLQAEVYFTAKCNGYLDGANAMPEAQMLELKRELLEVELELAKGVPSNERLAEEIIDVIFRCLSLSQTFKLNIGKAFIDKAEKNMGRLSER